VGFYVISTNVILMFMMFMVFMMLMNFMMLMILMILMVFMLCPFILVFLISFSLQAFHAPVQNNGYSYRNKPRNQGKNK